MVRAGVGTGERGEDFLADIPGYGQDAERSGDHGCHETNRDETADGRGVDRTRRAEYTSGGRSELYFFRGG